MSVSEKNIAFKIAQQFPALYRENGPELVKLVEEYYRFQETQPNQSVYNARRMFEYRDIANTLSSMIVFFQKKFLADLPLLDDSTVRFVVRNILDLYRRKGTEAGILLFFRMFYSADVEIRYPSQYMLKPSDSKWKTGTYLQLFTNNNLFYASDNITYYTYEDLISQNIYGSISKAKAVVDKINFLLVNKTVIPVLYITEVKGSFTKFDDIICRIDGEDISFGVLNGSASSLEVDLDYGGTTGNQIGDILNIVSPTGRNGKAIVTATEDEFTGTVNYRVLDGGFGYTVENTKLLVSNQVVILDNADFKFNLLETLRDSANNEGIVIGQNSVAVGVRMNSGESFNISRPIATVDRASNFTLTGVLGVAPKNDSSPGPLFPEGSPGDANTDVIVETLSNIETVSLITDPIQPFLNVNINAANYNDPPATQPMSGVADPVTLATPLNQAFDLTPFNIGTIASFKNINPGEDYVNDVFSLARDEVIIAFDRFEQIILVDDFSAAFSVGDPITQPALGLSGVITAIDSSNSIIKVRPYSYYGFKSTNPIVHKGNSYDVLAVERDYSSERFGENADIESKTLFSTGRISAAKISNSGFGYIDGQEVFLTDDTGEIQARAIVRANSQGITAGFWGSLNSHLNGYVKTVADDGVDEYFNSNMKIQDSDYYQEYSYEITSTIDENQYRDILTKNMHIAGTKMFSQFSYKKKVDVGVSHRFFVSTKDDFIEGGPDIVGPNQPGLPQTVTSDNATRTVDATTFTSDII